MTHLLKYCTILQCRCTCTVNIFRAFPATFYFHFSTLQRELWYFLLHTVSSVTSSFINEYCLQQTACCETPQGATVLCDDAVKYSVILFYRFRRAAFRVPLQSNPVPAHTALLCCICNTPHGSSGPLSE